MNHLPTLLVLATLAPLAADAPPADVQPYTVLYLNNRMGELDPCG